MRVADPANRAEKRVGFALVGTGLTMAALAATTMNRWELAA